MREEQRWTGCSEAPHEETADDKAQEVAELLNQGKMMTYDILGDYGAFQLDLPSLLKDHEGEMVVYHDKTKVGVFGTFEDAARFGVERYELGNFIVQKVEPQVPSRISYSLMV